MNLEELLNSNKIIFECVAGSHCYGTNTPQSDLDIRGCFLNSNKDVFSLFPAPIQVSDSKNDTTYYELRRFIQLALDNNPSILEYLFVPEDCIRIMKPEWKIFVENRHLFICKKAKHTFAGYAFAQIKRAKGENKWIWQAKDGKFDKKPTLEDFCWFVAKYSEWKPQPIRDAFHDISLPKCKVSCFEHVAYSYRLYGPYENDPTAGVFSGGKPLPKSISKKEEVEKLLGMLIVNHDAYEQALRDWQNYQTWLKERNEVRWTSQEKGEMDYDSKNLSHTIRLLLSGINILKNGEPLVRLSGNDLKLVKEVREGKYTYNEILDIASSYESELNRVYETTPIRSEPDRNKINELYCSVIGAL